MSQLAHLFGKLEINTTLIKIKCEKTKFLRFPILKPSKALHLDRIIALEKFGLKPSYVFIERVSLISLCPSVLGHLFGLRPLTFV